MPFRSEWKHARDDCFSELTVSTNRNADGTGIYSITVSISDAARGIAVEINKKDAVAFHRWLSSLELWDDE